MLFGIIPRLSRVHILLPKIKLTLEAIGHTQIHTSFKPEQGEEPMNTQDLLSQNFKPMHLHNERFWINENGLIYDQERGAWVYSSKRGLERYQNVNLQYKSTKRVISRRYAVPRLIWIYFIDENIPVTETVHVVDETLPLSPGNLKSKAKYYQIQKGVSKNSSKSHGSDSEFYNWNDTALYC